MIVTTLLVGDGVCASGGVSVSDAASTSYVCNGMPGATGQNGADGARGPAGSNGTDGATGGTGAAGTNGAAGGTGAAGANGTNGLAGAAGAQGIQGVPGAPGSQGAKGDPGEDSPALGLIGSDTGTAVAGHGYECVMGSIILTASPAVGEGIPAKGQLLSIASNTALFSLIGTTYGGNGSTTFALPDMQALAPNNMTYLICDQGIYPSRR